MCDEKADAGDQRIYQATNREWAGLAVLSLPCLLFAMDRSVLNLALPSISAELAPTSSELLWMVDIYGFFLAGSLLTMGTLGDRIGLRRLLLIGAAAFGGASILAAVAKSTTMLIAARALLGIAGATLAPSTLSLLRHMFLDSAQRTFAIGVWTTSFSVGGALGPLIGGATLQYFHWGAVFLIGVPVMALLLVLGPVLLPEAKNPNAGRLDVVSAVESLAAVLLVIFGLKRLASVGWHWSGFGAMVVGIAIGVLFARRQSVLKSPLIDPVLLRTDAFRAPLLAYGFGCFVSAGIALFVAQYLQHVLGLSPLHAGLWTLPNTLGLITGSLSSPAIARRMSPAAAIVAGLLLTVVGCAVIAQLPFGAGMEVVCVGLFVFSLGFAVVFVPAISLAIGSVPSERAGEASAISETGSELGAALGVAILGSIGAVSYGSVVVNLIPTGMSPDAAHAAMETLGGAVASAQQLQQSVAVPFLNAAREAFHNSLRLVAATSAVIMLACAAVLTVRWKIRNAATSLLRARE